MLSKPKRQRHIVTAVCSYLILVTTFQVCFARSISSRLINKPAPKLEVSEWVTGEQATLDKLKGKVVLLDFPAAPNTPSPDNFPDLIRFHKKYAGDGLVIIAIQDSSVDKESMIKEDSNTINLSDIPFRVAIDSPVTGTGTETKGNGKTITAYGVTNFPTYFLIDPDGKVQSFGTKVQEQSITLLLYGHTRIPEKEPASPDETLSKARKEFITLAIGAMVLILIGAFFVIRRRLGSF
ncbi:MAG: peroxiredoxin family protein [Planctomycetota bacterium]|jgi:peroxiredoxin